MHITNGKKKRQNSFACNAVSDLLFLFFLFFMVRHLFVFQIHCWFDLTDTSFGDKKCLDAHEQSGCGSGRSDEPINQTMDGSISSDEENDQISDTPKDLTIKSNRKRVERKFSCNFCKMKYNTEQAYKIHIIEHGNYFFFLFSFIYTVVRRRTEIHLNSLEMSFRAGPDGSLLRRCKSCSKYFKTIEDRNIHAMAEHKEKIMCEICEKSFRNEQGLTLHNYTYHNGIRPTRKKLAAEKDFKCTYCHRKYCTQNGLNKHITVHGK